ncbi:MAG TPA: alanine racemase [Candidatus Eremiobacteraceae bacterium]|nr:alanine racemase [Candidatus Eremiobacteraceae bacterium]
MRSWLSVDLEAVSANARALARLAAPASLCAVVKSNAYGHGLVPVARALADAGIPDLRFGVFSWDEAAALREAGLTQPIVVLGPVDDADLDAASVARVELALLSTRDVERFARRRLRAHVKVDTGLSRFGVARSDAARIIERCRASEIDVVGIYSHLANAEELGKAFVFDQIARLREGASAAPGVARHIAASAAALLWPEARLDMVRCGIALYGLWPSAQVRDAAPGFSLERALRWYAPVVHVREIDAGDVVGYGCEFVARRRSTIAVLPLGYADGMPRAAGDGRLKVRLAGGTAPIVGRVCMNACMLDTTDLPAAPRFGDTVEIDVEEAAAAAGTINYEIVARLPEHLERRYAPAAARTATLKI